LLGLFGRDGLWCGLFFHCVHLIDLAQTQAKTPALGIDA